MTVITIWVRSQGFKGQRKEVRGSRSTAEGMLREENPRNRKCELVCAAMLREHQRKHEGLL